MFRTILCPSSGV